MNRSHRARFTKKYDGRAEVPKGLESLDVVDVFASKSNERPQSIMGDKTRKSRCTYYRPSNTDFGQLTEDRPHDNYQQNLQEQYGFEPFVPKRVGQLEQFKAMFCNYDTLPVNPVNAEPVVQEPAVSGNHAGSDTHEEQLWQKVDTTDDLDKYMNKFKDAEVQNGKIIKTLGLPSTKRIRCFKD